jgi:uncharacterized protein (TIGR02452 family)
MKNKKLWIDESLYPICDDSKDENNALYNKNVSFTKDNLKGFTLSKKFHYTAHVITCPLPANPILKVHSLEYASSDDIQTVLYRMILVLNLAAKDSDSFLTGLWGCGAFGHPVENIIKLWKQAIRMATKLPKEIVFCIYLDKYTMKYGMDYIINMFQI